MRYVSISNILVKTESYGHQIRDRVNDVKVHNRKFSEILAFFCKSDQAVSCVSTTVSEEPKMHFFFGLLLKTGNG